MVTFPARARNRPLQRTGYAGPLSADAQRTADVNVVVEPLRIRSASEGFELVLGPPEERGGGSFDAKLVGPAVTATVRVYEHGSDFVPRFFAELAESWRGWDGEKDWESVESHIALTATADRLGHVSLRVILRDPFAPAAWRAEATLLIEAGQLEALAASAGRVFTADV